MSTAGHLCGRLLTDEERAQFMTKADSLIADLTNIVPSQPPKNPTTHWRRHQRRNNSAANQRQRQQRAPFPLNKLSSHSPIHVLSPLPQLCSPPPTTHTHTISVPSSVSTSLSLDLSTNLLLETAGSSQPPADSDDSPPQSPPEPATAAPPSPQPTAGHATAHWCTPTAPILPSCQS